MKHATPFKSILLVIVFSLALSPAQLAARTLREQSSVAARPFTTFHKKLSNFVSVSYKDARIMWQWALKKAKKQPITPELQDSAKKAFNRTGKPASIIAGIAIVIAAGIIGTGIYRKRKKIERIQKEAEKTVREGRSQSKSPFTKSNESSQNIKKIIEDEKNYDENQREQIRAELNKNEPRVTAYDFSDAEMEKYNKQNEQIEQITSDFNTIKNAFEQKKITEEIRTLIQNAHNSMFSLESKDKDSKKNLLQIAIYKKLAKDIIDLLIEKTPQEALSFRDKIEKETALDIALNYLNDDELLIKLIKKSPEDVLKAQNFFGETPLMNAIKRRKNIEVIKALIEKTPVEALKLKSEIMGTAYDLAELTPITKQIQEALDAKLNPKK